MFPKINSLWFFPQSNPHTIKGFQGSLMLAHAHDRPDHVKSVEKKALGNHIFLDCVSTIA